MDSTDDHSRGDGQGKKVISTIKTRSWKKRDVERTECTESQVVSE